MGDKRTTTVFLDKNFDDIIFRNPSAGSLNFHQVIREILSYIAEDQKSTYKVIIGSDASGGAMADFVSVIAVHRIGKGGRYFWYKTDKQVVYNLRDKIYREVMMTLELAQIFPKALQEQAHMLSLSNFSFEIHVDVGEKGDTKELIREVVGMVRGIGFEVVTKPYSFCASSIADKYTS